MSAAPAWRAEAQAEYAASRAAWRRDVAAMMAASGWVVGERGVVCRSRFDPEAFDRIKARMAANRAALSRLERRVSSTPERGEPLHGQAESQA